MSQDDIEEEAMLISPPSTFTRDQIEMADSRNGPWTAYDPAKPTRYTRVKPDIWKAWLKERLISSSHNAN